MANFNIKATLDPSGIVAGSRAASASLIGLQRQARVLGATFLRVFGVVGLGVGIKTSIDLIADFQQSIATATAIATKDVNGLEFNMAALTAESRRLGATTRFTAKEAADGMLFLARAGFKANEVLELTNQTLLLAQAGNLGVGRAADIVTNVMAGFSASVDQATRFVDVMALAANSSNTNIEQLGDALKFAGPVAAATGVQVEEAAAAIGALSNAGLQGTLAGTGLRRVLSELEAPSTKAQKFLRKLGLEQRDVSVSANGLVPAITKLTEAGFDVGDALEFFGDRGGPAFQVLKSAVEQGFLQRLTSDFLKAGGTATRIAKIMDETLKGALFALKSAFEAVILSISDLKSVGGLEDFIRGITQLLRNLAKNVQVVGRLLQVLGGVIIPIVLIKALSFAKVGFARLGTAMLAFPGGIVALAILTIVAALVAFADQISLSSDGFVTLEHFGLAAIEKINSALGELANVVAFAMGEASGTAASGVNQVGLVAVTLLNSIAIFLDNVIGAIILVPLTISVAWEKGFDLLKNVWLKGLNGIISITESQVNKVIGLLNFLPNVNIDPVKLSKFEVDETAINVSEFLGIAKAAFLEGIDQLGGDGPLSTALSQIWEDAIVIAAADNKEKFKKEIIANFNPDEIVPGDKAAIKFGVLLDDLDREIRLLGKDADARERLNKIKSEEEGFEKGLNNLQKDQLDQRFKMIQSLERQNQLITQLTSGQLIEFAEQERTLGELFRSNRIAANEYMLALEDLRLETLLLSRDIDSGEQRALIKVKQEIRDIASLTENTLVSAFQSVEDALISFVSTGEADFHKLAQTIFAETSRILLRLALLKAFSGFFAPGGNPIPNNFNPGGFQQGGSFKVGGSGGPDSQLVAFRASPGERVDVSRPGQSPQSAQQPPVINVNNIVVQDPQEAIAALESPEGQTVFMNLIQKNKEDIKTQLG